MFTYYSYFFLKKKSLCVVVLVGKPDEHSTQHGEHISLDESHQQLKRIHEEQHDDAEGVQAETESHTHRPAEEDHAGEREDHRVACHHVGKETDHQRKGLGEHAKQLDEGHDRSRIGLEEEGHLGPEYLLPILLVGKDIDGEHRAQCQEEGDIDVARDVGAAREDRNQSDEVTCQEACSASRLLTT